MITRTSFTLSLAICAFAFASQTNAAVVDSLDFSIAGQGFTHDSNSVPVLPPPANGDSTTGGAGPNDWTLVAGNDISSDTTLNEFVTTGGVMRVQDFGGLGTVTGSAWTATSAGTLDVLGTADTIGGSVFNGNAGNPSAPEQFEWFYSINGAPNVSQIFTADGNLDISSAAFTGIALNAGDTVSYGFSIAVNGANDGAEISSMQLDFTPAAAVPEPSSLATLAFLSIGMISRRRRS